jgi:restriction system protein
VVEEQNAYRGCVITTSSFTEEAIASAALASKVMLIAMDDLVRWHAEPPMF